MSRRETVDDRLLREADDAARREAASEFLRPLIIEAGAGTGKTTILVSRIISWCLGAGWQHAEEALPETATADEQIAGRVVDRVVAITFTEAAAAEMAERVGKALVAVERGEPIPGVLLLEEIDAESRRRRARAILEQVHRLRTSTIHSFCTWILKRFPVEAGVDPGFVVDADRAMAEQVAHDVVEDDLRESLAGERWPQWLRLSEQGVHPLQVVAAVVDLVNAGLAAEDLKEDPFPEIAIRSACERFRGALAELVVALGESAERFRRAKSSQWAARELAVLDARFESRESSSTSAEEDLELLRRLAGPVLDGADKVLVKWARREFGKEEQEVLAERMDEVAGAAAAVRTEWSSVVGLAPELGRIGCGLVRGLLAETRKRLGAKGVLSFDDLLQLTHRVLEAHPEVRRELRRGIAQLLVDEFQDTDRSQCEIVRLLVFGTGDDEGPRPGLFVVGDPKQSIYGWRSADLAAYLEFVEALEARGAVRHTLSVNFRSVPSILNEVERVVAPVMVAASGLQPPYQRLLPTEANLADPGFDDGGRAPVEYWVTWPEATPDGALERTPKVDASASLEAAAVAEDISDLCRNQGVPYSEVGILLRATSKLNLILGELRRLGLPFEVARDREYFRQREVVEAAALLRLLMDPADQLALLTVLRSEVVGVPDAALMPLWRLGLPACLLDLDDPESPALSEAAAIVDVSRRELPSDAPALDQLPDWPAALLAAVENLAILRKSLESDPAPVFIERLRSLWLAEVSAGARYLGPHRVGRLRQFYDEVERALGSPGGGLHALARVLRRAVAGEQEGLQSTSPERSRDAVQVMTVHGAKGLDFGHVYVLQMGASNQRTGRQEHKVLRGPEGPELRLFGWATPGLPQAEEYASQREAAELVRLLYVAMTRAKRRLVLAADWHQGHLLSARPTRMLELISHRWEEETVDGMIARSQWRGPRADLPGMQWVLPQLRRPGDAADEDGGLGVSEVRPEEIAALAARLARARQWAAGRMVRTHSGGVTALSHDEPERAETGGDERSRGGARHIATAVGTEVHRVLEELVFDGPVAGHLESVCDAARQRLLSALGRADFPTANASFSEVVDALAGGELLGRLAAIGDAGVVARELPLLLPPDSEQGPVGSVVGFADLVYRDPEDGCLVVADYKTDRVVETGEVEARALRYRPQLELYARALEQGLELTEAVRRELWFLRADRIVEV